MPFLPPNQQCQSTGGTCDWQLMRSVKCAGPDSDVYNMSDAPTAAAADAPWQRRMRELQGAVILASLGEVVLGMTGLVGLLVRYIGPLTIAPVITMIALPMVSVSTSYAQHNWWIALLYVPPPRLPCGLLPPRDQRSTLILRLFVCLLLCPSRGAE